MLLVKAELLSMRLLSKDDKEDMLAGLLPIESLIMHIKVWKDSGMPDYANGLTEPYKASKEIPMQRYRGIGKR